MRVIQEKDIWKLRKDGKVSKENGENVKSVPLLQKTPKPKTSAEERQAKILENMVKAMTLILQSLSGNDKKSAILLEMVQKIKGFENIKMPETPKTWTKLKLTPERDRDDLIVHIVVEKI